MAPLEETVSITSEQNTVITRSYTRQIPKEWSSVSTEFQVNTDTSDTQIHPSGTGLSGDGFVVTWQSYGQDGSYDGVYGQVFDSSGNKLGSEFRVNTYTDNEQSTVSVAGLSGGGFVATWQSYGQDGSYDGVYGQIFDSSGNKLGSEFRVNTYTIGTQGWPSVAGLSGDGFVVTWQSYGQDGSSHGIYGQIFDSSGNKLGSEFRVNTYTNNEQSTVSVAGLSGGGFVATWLSYGQNGIGYGVYGQRFSRGDGVHKDELVADFGGTYGHWHYDQEGLPIIRVHHWSPLSTVDPDLMTAVDINDDGQDELTATFSGYGLYIYDPTNLWKPINTVIPENMIRLNNGIACDFGVSYGLWYWTEAGGWAPWNTVDPDRMLAVDINNDGTDELVASFVGYGLYWRYEAGPWTPINTVIPENMIRLNNGIVCDFGAAYGLWTWTRNGDWVLRNDLDPMQMAAVDVDSDGLEELVVCFMGYGLYYHNESSAWIRLNTICSENLIPIDLFP
jgi:hypothetical protein